MLELRRQRRSSAADSDGPDSEVCSVPVLDTVDEDVARTQGPSRVPDEYLRCVTCAVSFSEMEDLRNHFDDEHDGASSPAKKKRYAIPTIQCPATGCAGKPRMNQLLKHFKDSHPAIQRPEKIICVCGKEIEAHSWLKCKAALMLQFNSINQLTIIFLFYLGWGIIHFDCGSWRAFPDRHRNLKVSPTFSKPEVSRFYTNFGKMSFTTEDLNGHKLLGSEGAIGSVIREQLFALTDLALAPKTVP